MNKAIVKATPKVMQLTNSKDLVHLLDTASVLASVSGFKSNVVVENTDGSYTLQSILDVNPAGKLKSNQRLVYM